MPNTDTDAPRAGDYLKTLPLYPLPHHALSRLVLAATRVEFSPWKNGLIRWFARRYAVDMADALEPDALTHRNFNSFFTRALRPGARPLPDDPATLACPVDGAVSQLGAIRDGRILQAKGRDYSVLELLGGDGARAARFRDGAFATLYLSPRDYHRVHMPLAGHLTETVYVPGRLFSVAPHTTRTVPRLFARNERLAALFETDIGPLAVVLVGAIFVACIETVFGGVATPPHGRRVRVIDYRDAAPPVTLGRGAELGRFNMGSTVILLFGPEAVRWRAGLAPGSPVRMGQPLGEMLKAAR